MGTRRPGDSVKLEDVGRGGLGQYHGAAVQLDLLVEEREREEDRACEEERGDGGEGVTRGAERERYDDGGIQ